MNRIDYNLEIIGEQISFTPRKEFIDPIVNSNNKIFEITADNSYGKTFILNLLAYGLDADKLDDTKILNSIKESIKRYDDTKSYSLEYNIDIDLPDNRVLSLTKEKGRGKLIQINNGAPISYKVLHDELSIIYDVPSNPSERLNAVIKDLNNWNTNLKNKFEKVARHIFEISKEFDNVRNESKIEILNKKIKELEIDIKKNKVRQETESSQLKKLIILKNLKNLISLIETSNRLELSIAKKQKEFKLAPKPAKLEKKDSSLIEQLNKELVDIESRLKKTIGQFIGYINNENEVNDLITNDTTLNKDYCKIRETDIRLDLFDDNTDYLTKQANFKKSVDKLKEAIVNFINEKKNDKTYLIHNSYSQFLHLLEDLIENNIDYLLKDEIDLDSNKFKKQLQDLVSKHKVKNYDELKSFLIKDLTSINGDLTQFMRTKIKLINENKKKFIEDDGKYYKIKAELDTLLNSQKSLKNDFAITTGLCAKELEISDLELINSVDKIAGFKYSIEKSITDSKLLENINNSINEIEKKIRVLDSETVQLVGNYNFNLKALEIEDKRKPSKYNSGQKKVIESFDRMLKQIISNLKKYDELISKIESSKLTEFKHEKDIKFMELAGKIIAYSMDNKLLRPDGKFIKLYFYDMIKQEFHCENNIIIKKLDVSTGLASANYLKQRIDNVEGKYVVVLLDEIGNMAQNALDQVIESIKNLENQNRLVIALFTSPNSDGIKINEY
ncbi:hypothetical protein L1S35_10620 [Flavobacterium sp. AS60]|uniref:hypothetical protein n=1 Tax=Flavobacterium anseongense TaxID=2910677 RepID=UPI001F4305FD|nr:hypothetical protein [Flavobacterium sp. AS60]MCF6130130.1 hypothetical protein [Flavobacterium sp. AS60]